MSSIKQRSEHALCLLNIWYSFAYYAKRTKGCRWLVLKTRGLIAYDKAITRTPN